jgi:hypothetical protein
LGLEEQWQNSFKGRRNKKRNAMKRKLRKGKRKKRPIPISLKELGGRSMGNACKNTFAFAI